MTTASGAAPTLAPADNERLLAAAAAAYGAGSGRPQRRRQARRDVVLALERSPVLLAVRAGELVCRPGPDGGVVAAFTDTEAAAAWEDAAHPAAPPAALERSDARNGGSPPDRHTWLAWLSSADATSVVVNPAGPLGSLLRAKELRAVRPRRVTRQATGDHPWLDLDERRRERAAIADLRGELSAAVAGADPSAFEGVRPRLDGANRLGSPMWAAELQYLAGQGLSRSGSDRAGVACSLVGVSAWSRLGDLWRAIDGLLETGGRLLAAAPPRADWQITYLNELAEFLRRNRSDYRDGEVQQLLDAIEYAR